MLKRLPAAAALMSILLALGFRVLPAYRAVFTPHGISFQEPDAWFHMRTVHNLLAHFPRRSGFDPYALYPGGENITTGPFWDYLVATTAWISGAGSPSERVVDETGAWLPAVLGALFPVLVFFLARRLFGVVAALFSAFWVAIIPGTFLWISHLGMPDHHAAEAFTSFLALMILCAAIETQGRGRWMMAAFSGVALAAYLSTRAAGVFVPAIFTAAAIFSPELAPAAATSLGTALLLFLAAGSASIWSHFTLLSLAGGLAVTVPLALLNAVAQNRHWSRKVVYGAAAVVALAAIGFVELSDAAKIRELISLIRSYLPWRPGTWSPVTIKELQPLWIAAPGGFGSLFSQFGAAWIFAIPALAGLMWNAWRSGRPAVTLFAVWSLAMILGVIFQLRMAAYAGLVVAILAGAASAWIAHRIPARTVWLRGAVAGILIALAAAVALPVGFAQTHPGQGPDPDWSAALEWLRWNTPEPMGDPLAWYRYWPSLGPGGSFAYPNSAYGILTFWDKGWWISGVARRIPSANGEQGGAGETSRFLTETSPDEALKSIRKIGARYVAIGPGSVTFELPSLVATAGREIDRYSRAFYISAGGKRVRIRVYLPDFYRSMAARLYLFDGRPIEKAQSVRVFLTTPFLSPSGANEETIQSVRTFASEKEAEQWMAQHPYETATLASPDATASCVDLEEIPWLKRVFVSSNEAITGDKQPNAVKIFELTPKYNP